MSSPADDFVDPALARELAEVLPVWKRDAAAWRESLGAAATLDVPYGPRPRQRIDFFAATPGANAPVALFFHGGYWQSMHRLSFSHFARGAHAHGVTVAVAGYSLCPTVTLDELVDEAREAVSFVARRFGRTVTVFGHSAGGHLAACLAATDWSTVHRDLPKVTVPSVLCVSGIYDLAELLGTPLNDALRLDEASAVRLSPLRQLMPTGRDVIAWVGELEGQEFIRQGQAMVEHVAASGGASSLRVDPGRTHFSVVEALAEPESAITRTLVTLARAHGPDGVAPTGLPAALIDLLDDLIRKQDL